MTKENETAVLLKDEERTRCEIWTRVMGYHRPVQAFNTGKKGEFAQRVEFREKPCGCGTLGRVDRH